MKKLEHEGELVDEGIDGGFVVGEDVKEVGGGEGDDTCYYKAQGADTSPCEEVVYNHIVLGSVPESSVALSGRTDG